MLYYVIFTFIPVFFVMSVFGLSFIHKKGWNNLQDRYLFKSTDFDGKRLRFEMFLLMD